MRHMTVTRELRGESLLAKTVNDQLARLERLMVETITGLAKLEQEKSRPVRRTGNGRRAACPKGGFIQHDQQLRSRQHIPHR